MFAEIYSVAATGVILGLSAAIVSAHYKSKDATAAPVKEAG